MKRLGVACVVLTLLLGSSPLAWGTGASLYKSKCSHCHGAAGEGKKGPALKGTSLSADDIVALLSKGDAKKKAPHSKNMSGISADHAKAIADYVKTLK